MVTQTQPNKRQKSQKTYPKPKPRKAGNGSKSRKKAVGQGKRNEAILQYVACDCGCGNWDLLDTRHGQKYIKGHGGKAVMKRRKERLIAWLTMAFLGVCRCDWHCARRWAEQAVRMDLERAKRYMQSQGWDYLAGQWAI